MSALAEFDEKEFWIQLFSIVARREERTGDEDVDLHGNHESQPQMNPPSPTNGRSNEAHIGYSERSCRYAQIKS
jgi:hypothetical protein